MSGKLVGRYLIVGGLRVACRNWVWLAVYIMYCGQLPFFTLVDCGPGGLAGWQELQGEAAVFGILVLGELFLGGEVWVKPPQARCTIQWGRVVVTGVNSGNGVSEDGMPRHVLDIRRVVGLGEESVAGDDKGGHGP